MADDLFSNLLYIFGDDYFSTICISFAIWFHSGNIFVWSILFLLNVLLHHLHSVGLIATDQISFPDVMILARADLKITCTTVTEQNIVKLENRCLLRTKYGICQKFIRTTS